MTKKLIKSRYKPRYIFKSQPQTLKDNNPTNLTQNLQNFKINFYQEMDLLYEDKL